MQIRCPVCDYTRDVNTAKVPPTAEFATCPKCRHRFRFRALDLDALEKPEPPQPSPEHADVWDAMDSLQDNWRTRDDGEREEDAGHADPHGEEAPHPEYPASENVAIPWENPQYLGYGQSLVRTTLWVLLQPVSFFASLTRRPALLPALLYYLIFGAIQTVFNMLWFHLLVPMMADRIIETLGEEAYASLAGGSLGASLTASLLSVPFHLALQLFISAGLIHVILRLVSPHAADFALSFKVAAYAAAALALVVVPIAGAFIAPIGYLTLLFIGCRSAFGLSWGKTVMAVTPLYMLMIFAASLITAGHLGAP